MVDQGGVDLTEGGANVQPPGEIVAAARTRFEVIDGLTGGVLDYLTRILR
jgi:hypothetical protein